MSSPHSDRLHSRVGASSAYRWTKCPGSVSLLEKHPMPTSAQASEGTRAHELSELMLLEKVVNYEDYPVDMIAYMRDYVDWVHTLMGSIQSVHGQWPDMHAEKQFNLKSVSPNAFGTNDLALSVDMGPLHIIDLKYGRKFVDVQENEQLMYYALGIIEELDLTPTKVVLWIYAPRMGLDTPASSWTVPMDRLLEYHKELKVAAKRVLSHPDEYNPGESQCFYCNKAQCPAIKEKMSSGFTDIQPISDKPAELSEMDTLDLVERYKWKEMFDGFFRDAAVILKHRAEQGESIPGYKLVRSTGNRAFKADTSTKALVSLGLPKEKLFNEPTRKTPTQIEAELKKAYPARKKVDKKKRQRIMDQFGQMVERPDKGLKLVSVDQPGEPVSPSLAFDDINPVEANEPDLSEFD